MPDEPLLVVIVTLLAVAAAPAMAATVTTGSQSAPASASTADAEAVTVDELTLTGVSFAMDVEHAHLDDVSVAGHHVDLTLEDASVRLRDATVTIEDATITEDGSIHMEEGSVTLEQGQLHIETGTVTTAGGFSRTVEDRTIAVADVSRSAEDVSGDVLLMTTEPVAMTDVALAVGAVDVRQALSGASLESASVTGVDASAALEAAVLERSSGDDAALADVMASVENAGVTIDGVAVRDGELVIDRLTVELDEESHGLAMAVVDLADRSGMVDDVSVSNDHRQVTLTDVTLSEEGLLALLGVTR